MSRPSKSVQKYVRSQIKGAFSKVLERKMFSRTEESLAVSSTAITRSVAQVPSGDDGDERNGYEIFAKKLVLRARMENADTNGNMVRIILARWKGDGSAVGGSDFPEQVGTTTMATLAPWSSEKLQRLQVLHDRVYTTDPDDPNKYIYLEHKLNNKVSYDSAATSSPVHNDFILFMISDSTAASHPSISYTTELSYFDA